MCWFPLRTHGRFDDLPMPVRTVCLLNVVGVVALAAAEDRLRLPDPLCVSSSFVRHTLVATGTVPAADIRATVEPAAWAQVTQTQPATDRLDLALTVARESRGSAVLTLRGAEGRVLATTKIQLVTLTSTATSGIIAEATLADKSAVFQGELVLNPHVSGLDLRFVSLGKGNTVQDGHTEWWVSSETFTPVPLTGSSWVPFRLVRPAGAKWVPYSSVLYQNGEQVGVF